MITTKVLENGVRLVVEPMPQVRSTAIGIWVKTGAVDEDQKYAGISHFVEHMMFKGTSKRSAKQIAGDIDAIGGQINAFTGKEATCYYVKSLTENWKQAADVLVDMLTGSLFSSEEMKRERGVICQEIKMYEDSPDDVAHDRLVEALFSGQPLANSVSGTKTTLSRITHRVMQDYVRRQYVRGSIVVSAAGSADPEELSDYFSGAFQSLSGSKPDRPAASHAYTPKYRAAKRKIQQTHICLGTKAFSIRDERSYAFQILTNILGGGMSSRLFQNIRERRGLAYSVYASYGDFADDGYFEIYAGINSDKVSETIDAVRAELEALRGDSVTDEELASSRAQMKASYVFGGESTSARMVVNGKNTLLFGRPFQPDEVLSGYDGVTKDSIDEVKQLICDFDQYSASVVSGRKIEIRRMMA